MLSASEEHASRWRGRGLPPWHPNFQHPTSTSQAHTPGTPFFSAGPTAAPPASKAPGPERESP